MEFPVNKNWAKDEKMGQKTGRSNRAPTLSNTFPGQVDSLQIDAPSGAPAYTAPQETLIFCHCDEDTIRGG